MAPVTLRNIRKSFGPVEVLRGLSLHIENGAFVALVGPSGCGKSTLLRLIAGLDDPSDGEVLIDDVVVNDRLPKDRDIAMVFQSYALYPHMTVRQNIAFSLELHGRPKPEIDAAIHEVSEVLGLTEYLERRPKALSGGQRQRVAMGRAIVRNPKVFLFDEPLSNLDAKLRSVMRKEIKLLHQRLKTTSVYVTHDQTEAMTMADRIVVMDSGSIAQAGAPLSLYNRPDNLFVAEFIGSPQMNFLRGEISDDGEHWFVKVVNSELLIQLPGRVEPGRPVVLGIRPEHLSITAEGAIPADVKLIEPTGSDTQITCAVDGHQIVVLTAADTQLEPGMRVYLSYDPAKLHVFDAASGQRVDLG